MDREPAHTRTHAHTHVRAHTPACGALYGGAVDGEPAHTHTHMHTHTCLQGAVRRCSVPHNSHVET